MPGDDDDLRSWADASTQQAIADFVEQGGVLIISNNFKFSGVDPLLGAFPSIYSLEWFSPTSPAINIDPPVTFPDPSHPLLNSPNGITPAELTNFFSAYHAKIVTSGLGSAWSIVAEVDAAIPANSFVGTAEAGFGSGGVIALAQDMVHVNAGTTKLAENSIVHINTFTPAVSSTDLWQGAIVTAVSGNLANGDNFFDGSSVETAGNFFFSDGTGWTGGTTPPFIGGTDFVEWETAQPITLESYGLFAAHDGGSFDVRRGFSDFRLFADTGAGFSQISSVNTGISSFNPGVGISCRCSRACSATWPA